MSITGLWDCYKLINQLFKCLFILKRLNIKIQSEIALMNCTVVDMV